MNKQSNYVVGLQYWFYPKCRVQARIHTATAISEITVICCKLNCRCVSKEKPYIPWTTPKF